MTDHTDSLAELTQPTDALLANVERPDAIERGKLTYNDYLKIPELLTLQVPQSDPPHHDEMLFIIIHQVYELWFKLILHELEQAMVFMNADEPLQAQHHLARVVEIMRVHVQQIHIVETMRPIDFLQFRHRLMPASGFQSVQFREVEFLAGVKDSRYCRFFDEREEMRATLEQRLEREDLRTSYCRLLQRRGYEVPEAGTDPTKRDDPAIRAETVAAITPIYQDPSRDLPLYLLMEALISFDEYLSLWRDHHVRVVARVIGWRPGTGGSSGVDYLRSTTTKRCFPELWEVRTSLQRDGQSGEAPANGTATGGCPMGHG